MKIALLCVESPLQLINAYEAIQHFNIVDYKLLIRYSKSDSNDRQIRKLIEILQIDPDTVEEVSIAASNKSLLDLFTLFVYRYRYLFNAGKFGKIYIGNYRSGFFSLIRKQFDKSQIILLDDGAKTIDIQAEFTDDLHYDLFTMYEIVPRHGQTIHANHFKAIKTFFEKRLVHEENTILFLGSKLSEIGIISEEYYLELMQMISGHYKGQKIIYIPHREEDPDKLAAIGRLDNIEIKTIDYPVELFGLFEHRMPNTVSSFYSSALLTMQNIYQVESEAFHFDYRGSVYEKSIDNIYAFYAQSMKVTDLKPHA